MYSYFILLHIFRGSRRGPCFIPKSFNKRKVLTMTIENQKVYTTVYPFDSGCHKLYSLVNDQYPTSANYQEISDFRESSSGAVGEIET